MLPFTAPSVAPLTLQVVVIVCKGGYFQYVYSCSKQAVSLIVERLNLSVFHVDRCSNERDIWLGINHLFL